MANSNYIDRFIKMYNFLPNWSGLNDIVIECAYDRVHGGHLLVQHSQLKAHREDELSEPNSMSKIGFFLNAEFFFRKNPVVQHI